VAAQEKPATNGKQTPSRPRQVGGTVSLEKENQQTIACKSELGSRDPRHIETSKAQVNCAPEVFVLPQNITQAEPDSGRSSRADLLLPKELEANQLM
jgi:hypothetical protein